MESHQEIAKRFDEKVERGEEGEGLVPVKATTKQNADVVLSIRFTKEEASRLRQFARDKGVRLSTLIRDSALATVMPESESDRISEMLLELGKNLRQSLKMMDAVTSKRRGRDVAKGGSEEPAARRSA